VVVHVIANEDSLTDTTPVQLDGPGEPRPSKEELLKMTIAEALSDPVPIGPAAGRPAMIMGGAVLPAPLVAATLAQSAKIERIIHPGDTPPEASYRPSKALAMFIRCRDLTCRCPGCDIPADLCDIDHTIPYPHGPTQASNLKCLCRKGHLLKTFCGWKNEQLPDGTVIWTTPEGATYTTHPGSRLLFPTLCKPTAPVTVTESTPERFGRHLKMPRRDRTRKQAREDHIDTERRLNIEYLMEAGKACESRAYAEEEPPPF
jgi:hypothetical protein